MAAMNIWNSLVSCLAATSKSTYSHSRKTSSRRTTLIVEALEDRCVPSAATLDLTTAGAIGGVNGAIFRQVDLQPTGTGVIDSFVRIQPKGNAAIGQGYNTGARPLEFDENKSPQFTRALQLGSVPTVNIGGALHREFLLDINQKSSASQLSLDELRFYFGTTGNLTGYNADTHQLAGLNAVYDLDTPLSDNWVKLDARLSNGSGSGDMLMYIPNQLFVNAGATGSSFVYLYSKFGVNIASNGGFEEWAVGKDALTPDLGSIAGTVYNASAGNTPYANATVFLDANGSTTLDVGESFTTTAANGTYSFTNLATGLAAFSTYDVTIVPPPGSTATPTDILVSLTSPSQSVTGVDFYLTFQQASIIISGRVSDSGAFPYTVTLTDITTMTVQTFNASASSNYSFTNLTAGHDYTVEVTTSGNVVGPSIYTFDDLVIDAFANFVIRPPV